MKDKLIQKNIIICGILLIINMFSANADIVTNIISFQQGDLQLNGTVVDSGYTNLANHIRSDQADAVNGGSTTAGYLGVNNANKFRMLIGFNISYITNVINASSDEFKVENVILNLSIGSGKTSYPATESTVNLHLTDKFEAPTWNTPGGSAPAGGKIGDLLVSADFSDTLLITEGSVISFEGDLLKKAINDAVANDGMVYFLLKFEDESSLAAHFFRPALNGHATVDYRPELIVTLTPVPEPATVGVVGFGLLSIIIIRKIFRK